MRKKFILGNWKMNGTCAQARALAQSIAAHTSGAQVVLFPPPPLLFVVQEALAGSQVALGAQDVSAEKDGAFTGDISATMLKDAGCTYVIVGHSERRAGHGETDAQVAAKAKTAMQAGLIPVICIGESERQRTSGEYLDILRSQLAHSLPEAKEPFLIAYEPVWAIGSGKTPTGAQIAEVHKTIACVPAYARSGAALGIVYGGSVKAANAREILQAPGVDGMLVGGASLKAEEFNAIIAAANDEDRGSRS